MRWPARLPCSKPLLSRAFCSSMEQAAPVVIVGAGPTGLTLSRLLSQLGVRSLLLERAPALTTHPQVHAAVAAKSCIPMHTALPLAWFVTTKYYMLHA